jgi:hypothetical protein
LAAISGWLASKAHLCMPPLASCMSPSKNLPLSLKYMICPMVEQAHFGTTR